MNMVFYTEIGSPLGKILMTANSQEKMTGLYLAKQSRSKIEAHWISKCDPFKTAIQQLQEYFTHGRQHFTLDVSLEGTEFQIGVWEALTCIDYGKTLGYGEIADIIGKPAAARAVGSAIGKNPISIIIPCHRVIGAKGHLTGFAGGLEAKQWLLEHEKKAKKFA